jgi:hypothetical protein
MNDFKIGPFPAQQPSWESADEAALADGVAPSPEATAAEVSAQAPAGAIDTGALVEGLADGSIEVNQAVAEIVEQVVRTSMAPSLSEALRQSIRDKLLQLVRDDPSLAALRAAMKR